MEEGEIVDHEYDDEPLDEIDEDVHRVIKDEPAKDNPYDIADNLSGVSLQTGKLMVLGEALAKPKSKSFLKNLRK